MRKRECERVCVVFNSGLGNGLLLVPMARALKAKGCHVTGVFSSPFISQEVIAPLGVLDDIVTVRPGWWPLLLFSLRHFKRHARAFLDFTSSSPVWLAVSTMISRQMACNRSKWYFSWLPGLRHVPPLQDGHVILQQLHLAGIGHHPMPGPEIYRTSYPVEQDYRPSGLVPGERYAVLQLSAANNSVQYKNWPLAHWITFLRTLSDRYPGTRILLVGDTNELEAGKAVEQEGIPGVASLIGKTSFKELTSLVSGATHYIGLDSGTMHLAALLGKPTFVLWGPTDPKTLGYEVFDALRHCDVAMAPSCHPCLSWIRPNHSLASHPSRCPHQRCIRELEPGMVFGEYVHFAERNGLHIGQGRAGSLATGLS